MKLECTSLYSCPFVSSENLFLLLSLLACGYTNCVEGRTSYVEHCDGIIFQTCCDLLCSVLWSERLAGLPKGVGLSEVRVEVSVRALTAQQPDSTAMKLEPDHILSSSQNPHWKVIPLRIFFSFPYFSFLFPFPFSSLSASVLALFPIPMGSPLPLSSFLA